LPDAFSANIPLARPGRCQSPLKDLPEERVKSVLDAAAQFRLRRKAARIRNKIDSHGRDEALFQEIAAALGYKENKLPFTLIAQRLPLKVLRENAEDNEAMLYGVAGFLEGPDLGVFKRSTRDYVRKLWDRWWPHRDEMQRMILPTKVWRLSGTRPLNHPQRRLAALCILVRDWPAFRRCLSKAVAGDTPATTVANFFRGLHHVFWKFHYTLTAAASANRASPISWPMCFFHSGFLKTLTFCANMRSCRRVCRTVGSKQPRPASLEMIRVARAISKDGRASTRFAPDLRRLLVARQLRLCAMPVPRANGQMGVRVKKVKSLWLRAIVTL
jgi:hypothetical protein